MPGVHYTTLTDSSTSCTIGCMCATHISLHCHVRDDSNQDKPRQGGCLGCCAWVHETVRVVWFRISQKVRSITEFDDHQYKRRSIKILDATPARMLITQSQRIDYARIVISTTGLTQTQWCQSVTVLGILLIGTSASLVSTPIPHLCASGLVLSLCLYLVCSIYPIWVFLLVHFRFYHIPR